MADADRDLRAARRAYIREHHPDAGGDPATFEAGLRRYERGIPPTLHGLIPTGSGRVRVVRSRRPDRVLLRVLRRVLDDRAGRPRRNLR